MTDINAEHLNALSSLIMSRMIYRRLHNRPELIKQVAYSLESEIKALDPDKVASYAHEWLQVLRDPAKLKAVGLDFTNIEWCKRMRLAAKRTPSRKSSMVAYGRSRASSCSQLIQAQPAVLFYARSRISKNSLVEMEFSSCGRWKPEASAHSGGQMSRSLRLERP